MYRKQILCVKKYLLLLILISSVFIASGQSSLSFNGYLKDMHTFYNLKRPVNITPTQSFKNTNFNLVHNRFNFKFYGTGWLTATVELRNRLFAGKFIHDFPQYADLVEVENEYFDLSWNWAEGDGWFVNTAIDRLYLDIDFEQWNIRVGRQRINWGMNLVWNPNDLFNAFDYLDFDYEERPGTDAVKFTKYTGATSSAELIYQFGGNTDEMSLAGKYMFSKNNYDIQVLGGWVGPDWVIGGGWSGDIKGAGFRGEITHFEPFKGNREKSFSATVASISADYTFPFSLYIHGSVLYNSHGTTGPAGGANVLLNNNFSAKMLSMGRWAVFTQVSYPFTPLFSGDLASIINPCDRSFFIGPGFTISMLDNLDLLLTGQLFSGEEGTEFGDLGYFLFARIKWSF